MIFAEIADASKSSPSKLAYLNFQICVAKESIGDAYKKMKRYKQAVKCY